MTLRIIITTEVTAPITSMIVIHSYNFGHTHDTYLNSSRHNPQLGWNYILTYNDLPLLSIPNPQ